MREVLNEAFAELGGEIVLAHAKDFKQGEEGDGIMYVPAGKGMLDYDNYLARLRELPSEAPLILHGLEEAEVDDCLEFLRNKIARLPPRES